MTEGRDLSRYWKVCLLVLNNSLMVVLILLVFYSTWSLTLQSHVTQIQVDDVIASNRDGNRTDWNQELQIQSEVNNVHDGKFRADDFAPLATNEVKMNKRRQRKRIRDKTDIIQNRPVDDEFSKTSSNKNASDSEQTSKKTSGRQSSKDRRKNLIGFRKVRKKGFARKMSFDGALANRPFDGERKEGGDVKEQGGDSRGDNTGRDKKGARADWASWGPCSTECGLGQQERVRSCGEHCQEIESKPCLVEPCEGSDLTDKWAYFEMFDLTDTEVAAESGDACEKWMKCSNKSIQHYLTKIADLPSCPCYYPISIAIDDKIYDSDHERHYSWQDASGSIERNDVYKPGARFCIRSLLPEHSVTLAAQHCCYDDQLRLITRGRDAGTPNLVSPQLSRELHKKVDILPWVMCKGDWTRYNRVVHPNNHRQCSENPCLSQIRKQVKMANSY